MFQQIDIHSLIARTHRVPSLAASLGSAAPVARQLDVALLSLGFKCSRELMEHLSACDPAAVIVYANTVLDAAQVISGAHRQHNSYFKDFPAKVPDTLEFWGECLRDALLDKEAAPIVSEELRRGYLILNDLPKYGRYQHTYEDLLGAHDALLYAASDRVTVLHLGGTPQEESHSLYLSLAGRTKPLSPDDLELLDVLAATHVEDEQPDKIPVRENRAVINKVRLAVDHSLLVDTVTDVLRLACAMSGGDVSLSTPTHFRSFSRRERRALLKALDDVVQVSRHKLADVNRYRERFKRLGSRLHPYESNLEGAKAVFDVALDEWRMASLASRVEVAFRADEPDDAAKILSSSPGMLIRSLDRLLRHPGGVNSVVLADMVRASTASTRVLFSAREHFLNRDYNIGDPRIFVNQDGRGWVTHDTRAPLGKHTTSNVTHALDDVLVRRVASSIKGTLFVEPEARGVAVALSGKGRKEGLGVLPRGSRAHLVPNLGLRFFVYWKEREERTDYDLSVLFLDDNFRTTGHASWTSLRGKGYVYSGDIVKSPNGATEFIDVDLSEINARYIVPQVNIYCGEGFEDVKECFFGYMQRTPAQKGLPFEPRTVRAKSDLFGGGRVALPLAFVRGDDGSWYAKWMHLNMRGSHWRNTVEENRVTTSVLMRAIIKRDYLTVGYVEQLARTHGVSVVEWAPGKKFVEPMTFLGVERPENLPVDAVFCSPNDLTELLDSV